MNNLTDDMAIASAGVGLLGSTASTAAVVGGVEVAGAVSGYVVNVCSMGMVAAGTPWGQVVLNGAPDFLAAQIPDPTNAPPNQASPGAIYGYGFNQSMNLIDKIFEGNKQ